MNNILAALLGGAGAGAQSYGASRIREQEQERVAAQRMAELQQQEASRIAQAREAAALRAAQAKEEGEQAAVIARAMGLDIPEGARLNTQGVSVLGQHNQNKRAAEAEAGRNSRFTEGLQGRLDQIDRQIGGQMGMLNTRLDAERALNEARVKLLEAQTAKASNQAQVDTRKPLPTTYSKQINEMGDVLRAVQGAKEGLSQPGADKAIGRQNLVANILLPASLEGTVKDYFNPEGTAIRARVGNLFSAIGKLRSGGAITDQEFQRLMRFLPSDDMPTATAAARLNELESEYSNMIQSRLDQWGGTYQTPDMGIITRRQQAPQQAPQGRSYSPNNPFSGGR